MPKTEPAAYHVTLTGVRRHQPGSGPPEKSRVWPFAQMVWSTKGYEGALSEMLDKFFQWYPDNAVILPDGERGQIVLTRKNRGRARGYLRGQGHTENGDYRIENDDALLHINKMKALSGKTPTRLTPKSDKEYSEALEKNVQSFDPYYESIIQMPSPVRGTHKEKTMPKSIRYKGQLYLPVMRKTAAYPDFKAALNTQLDELLELKESGDRETIASKLRLALYLTERLDTISDGGPSGLVICARHRFRDIGRVDDTHAVVRIQAIKEAFGMRDDPTKGKKGYEAKLAELLKQLGSSKSPAEVEEVMQALIDASPKLKETASIGKEVDPASGQEIVVYINRPDWAGPTLVYDALTHMLYYSEIDDELRDMMAEEYLLMLEEQAEEKPEVEEAPPAPERLRA